MKLGLSLWRSGAGSRGRNVTAGNVVGSAIVAVGSVVVVRSAVVAVGNAVVAVGSVVVAIGKSSFVSVSSAAV